MHICISKVGHHWFRLLIGAKQVPSHYLNLHLLIANWALQNVNQFSPENQFENVIAKCGSFFRQYCAYHNHTFNFLMQINFLWFDCDNHIKTICCCFWNENIIINKYHKIFAVYGAVTKNCSLILGYHANGCAQGILFNIPLINKSFMSTLMLPFVQMCHRDHSTHGLSQ